MLFPFSASWPATAQFHHCTIHKGPCHGRQREKNPEIDSAFLELSMLKKIPSLGDLAPAVFCCWLLLLLLLHHHTTLLGTRAQEQRKWRESMVGGRFSRSSFLFPSLSAQLEGFSCSSLSVPQCSVLTFQLHCFQAGEYTRKIWQTHCQFIGILNSDGFL